MVWLQIADAALIDGRKTDPPSCAESGIFSTAAAIAATI
jgi:hypothetical protein